jgi:hypothetical protein
MIIYAERRHGDHPRANKASLTRPRSGPWLNLLTQAKRKDQGQSAKDQGQKEETGPCPGTRANPAPAPGGTPEPQPRTPCDSHHTGYGPSGGTLRNPGYRLSRGETRPRRYPGYPRDRIRARIGERARSYAYENELS